MKVTEYRSTAPRTNSQALGLSLLLRRIDIPPQPL